MKYVLYTPPSEREILIKISSNWRLQRLFLWARDKCRVIGETLLIARILRVSRRTKKRFTRSEINTVLRLSEERVHPQTREWLYEVAGV